MATINGMYITVESEEPSYEVDVTEQPVETGINLIDHIRRRATTMSISGVIAGEDAAQIREVIKTLSHTGTIMEYIGRNYFTGIITNFQTKHHHRIANGYEFSATLKEIRIAKSSYIETLPLPIKAQAAPIISAGRKQKKKKGSEKKKKKGDKSIWEA
ncbi:hypothetical protein JNUCC42_13195 [Brevibacterium sp. JNUCC-42]|nr:hypothetical protein JNUCC42_13195 [Brevibacterium sp. JNUCC-42]